MLELTRAIAALKWNQLPVQTTSGFQWPSRTWMFNRCALFYEFTAFRAHSVLLDEGAAASLLQSAVAFERIGAIALGVLHNAKLLG
jgi:hypothetical protein